MRGDLLILLSDGIVILCIARCLLQWAGLDANHPLARFCIQATDWLVKPTAAREMGCRLYIGRTAVLLCRVYIDSVDGFFRRIRRQSDCRKFYIRRIGTDEGGCLCFIYRIVCPHGIKH